MKLPYILLLIVINFLLCLVDKVDFNADVYGKNCNTHKAQVYLTVLGATRDVGMWALGVAEDGCL